MVKNRNRCIGIRLSVLNRPIRARRTSRPFSSCPRTDNTSSSSICFRVASRGSSFWYHSGSRCLTTRYRSIDSWAFGTEYFRWRRNRSKNRASVRHLRMYGCLAIQSRSCPSECSRIASSSPSCSLASFCRSSDRVHWYGSKLAGHFSTDSTTIFAGRVICSVHERSTETNE